MSAVIIPCAMILMEAMHALVLMVSQNLNHHWDALTLMNVRHFHVTKVPNVPTVMVISHVNVILDSPVMVSNAKI